MCSNYMQATNATIDLRTCNEVSVLGTIGKLSTPGTFHVTAAALIRFQWDSNDYRIKRGASDFAIAIY